MKVNTLTKKIITFLSAFVLLVSILPTSTLAAQMTSDSVIDMQYDGHATLTVIKLDDDEEEPIKDVTYDIYLIATISQSEDNPIELVYTTEPDVVDKNDRPVVVSASLDPNSINLEGLTPAGSGTSGSDGKIKFTDLAYGIYLVVESAYPSTVISAANNFLVSIPMSTGLATGSTQWLYDVEARPKNTLMGEATIKKEITDGVVIGTDAQDDIIYSASYGDVIDYKITVTLPSTFEETDYTSFIIKDTPSAGLQIDQSTVKVYYGVTELDKSEYVLNWDSTTGGFTVNLIYPDPANADTLLVSDQLKNGMGVSITYSATLLGGTSSGGLGAAINTALKNAVEIDYEYVQPGGGTVTPEPITPDDPEPTVYTYNFTIEKVDGDNSSKPLENAVFVLMDSSGDYMAYDGKWTTTADIAKAFTVTSGTDGLVTFTGLAAGDYTLMETVAPKGYSLLKDTIAITIDSTTSGTTGDVLQNIQMQVVNKLANSWTLPSTGLMGIYIFTIGGVILIAAAIILLSKNRKKSNG